LSAWLALHRALAADLSTKPAAVASRHVVAQTDPRWAALEHAHWLADGRDDAPRKVYVFTDSNCPYCTKLCSDARPWVKSGKVQLRHLIVGILTPTREGKAAAILGEGDPAAKLASYEASHALSVSTMLAGGQHHPTEDPGLEPLDPVPSSAQAILAENLKLMQSFKVQATPGDVFLDEQGHVQVHQGIALVQFAEVLGAK
jgi:thiol:disulfide interchange protein DsbG